MPKIHVEKSTSINAPLETVKAATADFAVWPIWSPWLITEPDATVNVHGAAGQTGHGYDWNGDLVGSGAMQIRSVDGNRQDMDLQFLKPFKSQAEVALVLNPVSQDTTDITWTMDTSLPFFLFFMTGMMKSMIGMDFERGLKMLKAYCEEGEVNSSIEIVGVVDAPESRFIGFDTTSALNDIGDSMDETLPLISEQASALGLTASASAIGAIYNRMDMKSGQCDYTAMVPVIESLDSIKLTDGFRAGTVGGCKALKVIHKGAYKFLPNGWNAAYSYQRKKKLKLLKHQRPFEFYPDDPATTPVADLTTEIFIPVKG
jgi:effector-binding domain-containing protein